MEEEEAQMRAPTSGLIAPPIKTSFTEPEVTTASTNQHLILKFKILRCLLVHRFSPLHQVDFLSRRNQKGPYLKRKDDLFQSIKPPSYDQTGVTLRKQKTTDMRIEPMRNGKKNVSLICCLLLLLLALTGHAADNYSITSSAGSGGTISPSGAVPVNSGSSQTFTITPNIGYQIADVKVDGASQGAITSYSFANVSANHSIAATFANPITITIDSPPNGASINRPDIMVTGTISNASGYETGVTVNSVVANIYGNQFVANHVPLTEGSNAIVATAIDANGATSTASTTVNAVNAGNYITLTTDTQSGILPISATLKITGTFGINNSTILANGAVQPDFLSSSTDQYQVKITTEGQYFFTVTVIGPDHNQYQDAIAISALDTTEIDAEINSVWDGMKNAFTVNDVTKAVNYCLDSSKERYTTIFSAVGNDLPQIAQDMQDIKLIYLQDNIAKYRIKRIEDVGEISYYIYFVKDNNGLWKIQQF